VGDDGVAAVAGEHPGHEPGVEVGRQVADHITTGGVNPDAWVVYPGWIGDQDERRARLQSLDDSGALRENGPVNGGLELSGFR
jgi:hypothetical protein